MNYVLEQIKKTESALKELIAACYSEADGELGNKLLDVMDNHPDSDFQDMLNKMESVIDKH